MFTVPVRTQDPVNVQTAGKARMMKRVTLTAQASNLTVPQGKRWEDINVEMHYATDAVAGNRWCLYKHYGVGFSGPQTYPSVSLAFSSVIPASSDMTCMIGNYGGFDGPVIPTNTLVSYRQIYTQAETGDTIQLNFMQPDVSDAYIAWIQYYEVDV